MSFFGIAIRVTLHLTLLALVVWFFNWNITDEQWIVGALIALVMAMLFSLRDDE